MAVVMMHSLPPYSGGEPECPKCKHRSAQTTYRCEVMAVGFQGGIEVPEHLERCCNRCTHTWKEAVC